VETLIDQASPKHNGAAITIEQMTREVLRRLSEPASSIERQAEPRPRAGFLELPVPVGISVHHVHLCAEHIAILFGEGHDLHVYNELYQKGYYAAKEQVMVVGRRRCLEKVRVLGPPRAYSQVELAQSDAVALGLKLSIAMEGADPASRPVTLVGPEGSVTLPGSGGGGAILARRHVHMSDVVAAELGLKQGDLLDLRVDGVRPTTLHGILVRVKAGWRTEVHVDTDEGNACGIRSGQVCTLMIPR
jgi:putative phosphotransacetylase